MGNIWSFLIMSVIPEIERDDSYLYPSSMFDAVQGRRAESEILLASSAQSASVWRKT